MIMDYKSYLRYTRYSAQTYWERLGLSIGLRSNRPRLRVANGMDQFKQLLGLWIVQANRFEISDKVFEILKVGTRRSCPSYLIVALDFVIFFRSIKRA
jgi:hypothetical protein